jgi:hypothetical protein
MPAAHAHAIAVTRFVFITTASGIDFGGRQSAAAREGALLNAR